MTSRQSEPQHPPIPEVTHDFRKGEVHHEVRWPKGTPVAAKIDHALRSGIQNLTMLQNATGQWPGDYGGPMFLLPMYIGLAYVTGRMPSAFDNERMRTYFFNVQRADGSMGLHAEATQGSMFTSALSYVALRLLGVDASDSRMERLLRYVHAHGSPLGAASWGKFTLCLLGLYKWEGIHPILPELWILPRSLPFHPGNLWCHCRQVYLPMAWLYGARIVAKDTDLLRAIRNELYQGLYDRIDFSLHKDTVAHDDNYRKSTAMMKAANASMGAYEALPLKPLRKRAMKMVFEHIAYEDQVTRDIDIGPVNAVLNTWVHFADNPTGENFTRGWKELQVYLWDGHDGMKMQGYNSSELWDTAFATQALIACDMPLESATAVERAYNYIRDNQILEDVPENEKYFRHASKGGWPFSNRPHGWPITDCTSEGLKCALALEGKYSPAIPTSLLKDSVKLLLSFQNDDGGWATYERKRGPDWLEQLNPSQVFGDIMVDYSHVECSSASIQALVAAKSRFPNEFDSEIDTAVKRGVRYLRSQQRDDGSFEGNWAVCFTYGTWFAVTGLLAAGAPYNDVAIRKACDFLKSKQREDGGFGEAGDSCRDRRWVEAKTSQVVQTAWVLLTWVRAKYSDTEAMHRAAEFLMSRQLSDGSWAREALVGVFNRTCLINYDNYRHYFPIWALAEWKSQILAQHP